MNTCKACFVAQYTTEWGTPVKSNKKLLLLFIHRILYSQDYQRCQHSVHFIVWKTHWIFWMLGGLSRQNLPICPKILVTTCDRICLSLYSACWKISTLIAINLPIFPKTLLTTTICPCFHSIICGRTALVKEMVPKTFKSKTALSTSNGVFLIQDFWKRPPLLTKIST